MYIGIRKNIKTSVLSLLSLFKNGNVTCVLAMGRVIFYFQIGPKEPRVPGCQENINFTKVKYRKTFYGRHNTLNAAISSRCRKDQFCKYETHKINADSRLVLLSLLLTSYVTICMAKYSSNDFSVI